jgi:hypothetical protein
MGKKWDKIYESNAGIQTQHNGHTERESEGKTVSSIGREGACFTSPSQRI